MLYSFTMHFYAMIFSFTMRNKTLRVEINPEKTSYKIFILQLLLNWKSYDFKNAIQYLKI